MPGVSVGQEWAPVACRVEIRTRARVTLRLILAVKESLTQSRMPCNSLKRKAFPTSDPEATLHLMMRATSGCLKESICKRSSADKNRSVSSTTHNRTMTREMVTTVLALLNLPKAITAIPIKTIFRIEDQGGNRALATTVGIANNLVSDTTPMSFATNVENLAILQELVLITKKEFKGREERIGAATRPASGVVN